MDVAPQDELIVPFKKTKLAWLLVMGLVLVGVSILLATMPDAAHRRPEWYVRAVGIAGTTFFGACLAFILVKLFDHTPGLVVDRQGIVDRTTYAGVGRIHWPEIRGLRVVRVGTVRYLAVDVHNSQRFLDRGNVLQRFLRAGSVRLVGGPIAIASVALDADFDQLVGAIGHHFNRATGHR